MANNDPTVQITVKIKKSKHRTLEKLAVKTEKSLAQLVRDYIDQGMGIDKTMDDIDLIRKYIREELEAGMDQHMSRIIKLLIKHGCMIYPMAYFSAMMSSAMAAEQNINYDDLLESAKKEGAKYLGIGSDAVDIAYKEMSAFSTGT